MKTQTIVGAVLLLALLSAGTAYPAAISLGYAPARPGDSVEVAVNVSADTDLAGVNVRLEYDTSVFSYAVVTGPGTLLQPGHSMQFTSPVAGRIDAVAWAPAGTGPFKARSGVVFTVVLQVRPTALAGISSIPLSSQGPVILASSGLSDMNGNSIPHTVEPGTVDVRSTMKCDVDGDGSVTVADLYILLRQWHRVSAKPLPTADINWDTIVDADDLMILQADWLEPAP